MPQTPLSTSTPYCDAASLVVYHDWQQVADMVRDGDGPRPTRASLLDAASAPGSLLQSLLLAASGEIESACLVGDRYEPLDLQAMTGAGLEYLKRLTADLAFWRLSQRRQPNTGDPKSVPGAEQALEELRRLRDGEAVFGLRESAEAGLPEVVTPDVLKGPQTVVIANRLFGVRGRDISGR